jgi:hypothetical protein
MGPKSRPARVLQDKRPYRGELFAGKIRIRVVPVSHTGEVEIEAVGHKLRVEYVRRVGANGAYAGNEKPR